MKLFEIEENHPRNISRKFEKDSSFRTGSKNLILVRKRGNEQTDRLTRNLK